MSNSVGRPLKFKTVEELEAKIDAWLKDCEEKRKPLTITGLALALDTSRKVLVEYEDRDEFSNAIKKAKLMCENYTEAYLFSGKNVVGAIFNLKNNYNWRDKQETEHSGKISFSNFVNENEETSD